jgi:hypothetical protein
LYGEDGGGQCGFAVIDVADRADVDVNLLHLSKLPGCDEQPKGYVAALPNRFCDFFSTTSETRASRTTGCRMAQARHALDDAGSVLFVD